ncbi:pimeloyl-ACP methyl ester carboxylesterase [Aeromicrobium panaciterrae]|uniref:Pimeloyl-ACP methyl ester carboxylesterase n=1 Tax=Aeromicrobium panaciterrae TaxID=363861 RepID=A0ABU1UNY8_9ACTN|nr:alpha/beta hydrolase [Aeromicrobium panaciterrae]MDR7086901.1 pimeloyl-ACP methyl ester carboxylesterase [Aeromicrobium panaciterrae]
MSPTFVLVPGAGGMASYWHLVQQELTDRGFANLAVDLPGDDPNAGLPEYVELVAQAASDVDDAVIVGQSIGGFSASWAAGLVPVRQLILLNAMIPNPGETAGEWWSNTGSAEAKRAYDLEQGRDPDAPFDDEVFLHDVPAENLKDEEERDETETIFATPWGLTAWPHVQTRVLAGVDDRLFPFVFQQRVARERLGLEVEGVPGGHLPALSRPTELTEALVREF